MSSNQSPPPTAASQSDSKTEISHETPPPPPPIPPSQSDSKTQISHETPPRTPPIPPPQSHSKTQISLDNPPTAPPNQATKDELFQKAMQEDWDAVVKIYQEKGDIVWTAEITSNKETVLHIHSTFQVSNNMSYNPPPPTTITPPPPPSTATTSQSASKTQRANETTPPIPPSQSDSKTRISHETPPRTAPIPPSQSESKTQISLDNPPTAPLDQATKDELFQKAMQEDCDAVVKIYQEKGDTVWTAKITRNNETGMHIHSTFQVYNNMSYNPPPPTTTTPPPPPTTATTSQSASETQRSNETTPPTPPIPPSQSDNSKTHLPGLGLTVDQDTKEELFRKAMKGNWNGVVKIYEDKKDIVWTAKITRNKETALHIAISDSKTEVVKKLLDIIDPIKIREIMNDMDENPLHLAASLGQAEMCRRLVEKDPELIGARNKEGETPLFKAALHGKEKAFYALHPQCTITGQDIKHDIVHCKRTDGNSILHVAIRGEYFRLAYQIIYWYPELIKFYNEKGQTALHFLAQNPSAFRSGCHLGPFDDFIYRCLIVDHLDKVETPSHFKDENSLDFDFEVPGNYQTCLDLLKLSKYVYTTIAPWVRKWEDIKHDICKIFNKDEEKHKLPVRSTGKDKKQAPEEQRQDIIAEDSSKGCERSHIDIKVGDEIKNKGEGSQEEDEDSTEQPHYPSNYNVFFHFVEFVMEFFLFVLGLGYFQVRKIKVKKQKHKLACQIMKQLVHKTKFWEYMDSGSTPITVDSSLVAYSLLTEPPVEETKETKRKSKDKDKEKMVKDIISALPGKEVLLEAEKTQPDAYRLKMLVNDSQEDGDHRKRSPVLIAVKMRVKEMVEEILNKFPVAIRDEDADKKNVVLLAVENKHPKIYNLLLDKYNNFHESVFQKVDKDGNSAIHLAATIGKNQYWRIPGAALQMQWELKWYKYIKTSMPQHFFAHRNTEGKTSREVFAVTHRDMIKDGGTWLTNTSQSCSVVAALIATVAYASATTVPGGAEGGKLALRGHPAFDVFTIASLVALCLSVTSLTMFLSILTSRYQVPDFLHSLPTKLILGLTSLFISIAAMLISFCAGHFFDLEDQLRQTAYPIYAITCLPISIFAIAQFPLYLDLIKSTIITVPKRSYEVTSF